MNGEQMDSTTKERTQEIMKTADVLNLEAKYNPEAFSFYDNGEELQRIKSLTSAKKLSLTPSAGHSNLVVGRIGTFRYFGTTCTYAIIANTIQHHSMLW